MTTTREGARLEDIQLRIARSLTTWKVIDDCVVDETPHAERSRYMNELDDVRIEFIVTGALAMFQENGVEVSELRSQIRMAQDAVVRRHGSMDLRPGWSLGLMCEDPLTGKPWDLGKASVRKRLLVLVHETKLFLVLVSPRCILFGASL